jgi:long-chain fatty acid transport protein
MIDQFCQNVALKKNAIASVVLIFFILAALAGSAGAGGLYLSEFGSPSMGTAGAGAQALADNASTAFHNPAGMTRLNGKQLMVSGGLLYSTIKFDPDADTPIPGNDGGDAGGPAPILGGFYAHSLSEDWKLGVSVISISGAVLDYNDNWTGRYLIQDVTLLTITVNPTAATGSMIGSHLVEAPPSCMLPWTNNWPLRRPMVPARSKSMAMTLLSDLRWDH